MSNNYEFAQSSYNSRQRFVCVTLGVAGTISVSTTATMANATMPTQNTPVFPAAHTNILPHALSTWQSAGQGLNQSASKTTGSYGQTINAVKSLFHGQPVATSRSLAQGGGGNNLNLASNTQSFLADNIANFKDITIQVGGTKEVVTLASKLTAGEVVAAEQVLTGGTQTIKLSGSGTATGGSVTLNSSLLAGLDDSVGGSIGSLTISHGVKVIDTVSLLSIGSLSNYGSILTASSTSDNTDTISAGTILNAAGGKIGSYAGASSGGSGGLVAADPSLSAVTSLTNNGTISSAGNLTISAPVVYNVASHGSSPTITAAQNVNISTQNLSNSGVVAALSGNVNVASTSALTVTNAGGTLQAQNGNINLTSNNANLNVSDGNLDSQQVNLKAGAATVNFFVDNASGIVNASGNAVHLYTSTSELKVGNVDTSGDPTFESQNTIIINGTDTIVATDGGDLSIVSGKNILSNGGVLDTTVTDAGGGPGGNLTLVAGANFTLDVNDNVLIADSANAGKGSATGGLIDLTGANGGGAQITSITTAGTGATGIGGYVQMVAYAGTATGSGTVTLPTTVGTITAVPINAGTATAGNKSGDVSIIAGATSGTAITTAGITGGAITIGTFTPTVGTGAVINGSTGAVTNGIAAFGTTSSTPNASGIIIGGDVYSAGNVKINTGGVFNAFNFQFYSMVQGPQLGFNGGNGHSITINSAGDLTVGSLLASGMGGTGSGSFTPSEPGGTGGNGGTISLTSTNGSVFVQGIIGVSGGGGGGGAGGSEGQNATAGGAGGMAGTVNLSAGQNVTVTGLITAYDGGAGGAGGSQPSGVGGGGGGGSAIGGGGGGGGGGLGTSKSEFAAGGGGGLSSIGSGGGGGGSYDNDVDAGVPSTGGGGGNNNFSNGLEGTGNVFGNAGGGPTPQGGMGGGLVTAPGLGGAGSTSIAVGGGGGQSSTNGLGIGQAGGTAAIVAGHGSVNIVVGGIASGVSGSTATPMDVETSTLTVNSNIGSVPTAASANIKSTSGVPLTINWASVGATGTLLITNGPTSTIPGNNGGAIIIGSNQLSGGTVTVQTLGTSGSNDITITGNVGEDAGTVNLIAGTGGAITTSSPGMITSTTANLYASGAINVGTNVGTLTAVSTGSSVTINQGTTALNLSTSSAASGSTFAVTSQEPINVTGAITATGSLVQLTATGPTNGIDVGAAINSGATGTITLTAAGAITDATAGATALLTGNTVNMIAGTSIGTAKAPIFTDAAYSITGQTGATGNLAVTDSNKGPLAFDAQTASSGTITLNLVAVQLNVVEAPYATVAINDTGTNANVLLNSTSLPTAVFGGSGTFSLSTTGNINTTANTTAIQGSSVSLTSSTGSIGSPGQQIATNSGRLTLNAGSGSLYVTDSAATSNVAGSVGASGTFALTDTATGGTGLTVTNPIAGSIIELTTTGSAIQLNAAVGTNASTQVQITASGDIIGSKAGLVSGASVALDSTGGSVGSSDIPIFTAAGKTLTSANSISGNTYISQTGAINLGNSGAIGNTGTFSLSVAGNLDVTGNVLSSGTISLATTLTGSTLQTDGTIGGAATTNITLTSASDMTINNVVTGTNITAKATGNFLQNTNGTIVGNDVAVSAKGTFTADGSFEGSPSSDSSLGLSSVGAFSTSSNSKLGTTANPFYSVIVTVTGTGTSSGTIGGQVNANASGTGSQNGLQFTTAGALNIGSLAALNDSTDILKSSSTATVGGTINDANLTGSSTGLFSTSAIITTTTQGSIAAPTFSNSGTINGTTTFGITTSGTGAALTNTGTGLIEGGAITLTNTGTGQTVNNNGGAINATGVTVVTSNLSNLGTINGGSTLTLSNPKGNLAVTGGAGSFTTGAGGSILLSTATGSITVGTSGSSLNPFNLAQTNSFAVKASGTFTSPLTGIAVVSDAQGNGGTINIAASNILFNGGTAPGTPFALSANGSGSGTVSGTGNGGSITLNLPGTATAGITIGTAAGNYTISASGPNGGGTVSLTTPGTLTVNTASLSIDATTAGNTDPGATVFLSGTKSVLIVGNLDTRGSSTNYGDITIVTSAKTAFNIDGNVSTTTNGQTSTTGSIGVLLAGDQVSITDAAGVTIGTNDTVSGATFVTVNGSALTNNGTVSTPSLTIASSGTVTVAASTGTYPQLTDFSATSTTGGVTVTGATPSATDVTLSAVKGAVTFGTGATSLSAFSSDVAQDGGSIKIDAKTLTVSSGGLKLDAAGIGKDSQGGTVTIDLTGTTNLTVGGTGTGALIVLAQNTGTGINGSVSIVTGGNLTVDAQTGLNVGSNQDSGILTLSGKILHISDAASFATNTTNLNLLSLTSNTGGAFVLGGATGVTNGISDIGGLTISAAQIIIANNGGAIYNGAGTNASTLQATSADGLTVSAKADIGKTSALLAVDASQSNALQLISNTGNAYVNVTLGDEIYSATVSKTLQITSGNNLTASGTISAKTLNLSAADITSFNTNATAITADAATGGFTVTDSQTALLTLNSITAATGVSVTTNGAITAASAISANGPSNSITLTAGGTITTKGAINAGQDITLQAGGTTGSITQGAQIGAGNASGDTLTLTATGKGVITDAKAGYGALANTVDLNTGSGTSGGSIGSSHTATFKMSAATLNIDAPGTAASAYISNAGLNATIGTATVGKTFDYTGIISGTTATINAPTVLISSSNTGTGLVITTNATSLQAAVTTSGNITVVDTQTNSVKLNTLTATAGDISVTSGGTITTAGVLTGPNGVALTSGGNGNIVIGNAITSTNGLATITTTSGTGTISDAGAGTYKVAGQSVDLSTTLENIGATKVAFRTATQNLTLTTGAAGSVTVTNTNTLAAGTDTLQTANVGSLTLTDTSTNTKNTGTLVIGNIAASATSGAITVSTNEKTLSVADTSTITTTDGNITLLDTYAASGANLPLISIGGPTGPTLIKALGVIDTPTGNVYIALGAVPATSTLKAGTPPTGGSPGPVIDKTGTTVFFGTTSNPNGSITTGDSDTLTGTGSNLSFTTGKNGPSQITLGNAVTIIADPPLGIGSASGVITPASSTGSSGGSVSIPTPTSAVSVPAGAADCVAVLAPVLTSPSTTDSAHASTDSLSSVLAASLSAQVALGSSPSIIGAALISSSLANPNTSTAAGGCALGNNLGAAASNNAVNSLSTLHSSMPIPQSAQPAISQTSNSQPFSPNTLTGSASNITHQTLDNGALLFNSDENTIVDTPYGSVNLAAGSVALLVAFDQGLAVYDLHDGHKGAIVLSSGTHSTALVPGQSAVLTKSSVKSFEDVNPTQFVAYRKLASRAVGSENKLYQAEFDIMSMMSGLKPLRNMSSSDCPKTRKVMATMLKTAAILSGLTQGGEPFNLYVAPSMTAYAPSINQ